MPPAFMPPSRATQGGGHAGRRAPPVPRRPTTGASRVVGTRETTPLTRGRCGVGRATGTVLLDSDPVTDAGCVGLGGVGCGIGSLGCGMSAMADRWLCLPSSEPTGTGGFGADGDVLVGFQRDMETLAGDEVRGLFVRAWGAERGVDGRILV